MSAGVDSPSQGLKSPVRGATSPRRAAQGATPRPLNHPIPCFSSLSGPPKIAMDIAARTPGIPISPHDVAARVDSRGSSCADGSRKIKRSKLASAQHKAVQVTSGINQTWRGTAVKAGDIAARVDPANRAEYSSRGFECTGEINRGETVVSGAQLTCLRTLALLSTQQIHMELTVEALVPSQDLPRRIDLPRGGNKGSGEVNRTEYAPAQQETMGPRPRILADGIGIGPHDVPAGVDPEGDSATCARKVNRTEYPPPHQEAVGLPIRIVVAPDNVAAAVNPVGDGEASRGEINSP